MGIAAAPRPRRYGRIFAVGEFRALWTAELLASAGDLLARVALSVLVFSRTGSALATGATYAMTFLPSAVAGPMTSGLADRLLRRIIMVVSDLVRAMLVGLVAVPVLLVLVFVAELFAPAFSAARAATVPDVFTEEDDYVAASAVSSAITQLTQVGGFAVGGAVVALLGARSSLLVDAATFVASALLVRLGVRHRAATATAATEAGRRRFGGVGSTRPIRRGAACPDFFARCADARC